MNQNKSIVKKESKKARTIRIYSEYNIISDGEKLYHTEFGFINPLLIDGNDKIGKGVWHFSTLPTNKLFIVNVNGNEYTESGTCPCHCGKTVTKNGKEMFVSTCYATKGNYNYGSTKKSLMVRTWLVRHDLDFVARAILAQIKIDGIKVIRVHASGDFDSMAYAEMWRNIALNNPQVIMWTYTKVKACEDYFDDIPNFNVVKSVIAGKGFNYGHCDYILSLYDYLTSIGKSVYICRCGIDKNQHCNACTACSKYDYVLFLEHSTDYKAEKDKLFPIVKALIESQTTAVLENLIAAD